MSNEPEMEESTNFSRDQIIFVHAMLCKILGQADKSKALYKRLNDQIRNDQCARMKRYVFSVVLISLQKDRRITENTLADFSDELTLCNPSESYDEQFTKSLRKVLADFSGLTQKKQLTLFLSKLPLFKRVQPKSLFVNYIDKVRIVEKKKGDLIVVPDKN